MWIMYNIFSVFVFAIILLNCFEILDFYVLVFFFNKMDEDEDTIRRPKNAKKAKALSALERLKASREGKKIEYEVILND
jgi:hypothetical protein